MHMWRLGDGVGVIRRGQSGLKPAFSFSRSYHRAQLDSLCVQVCAGEGVISQFGLRPNNLCPARGGGGGCCRGWQKAAGLR